MAVSMSTSYDVLMALAGHPSCPQEALARLSELPRYPAIRARARANIGE